MKIADILLSPFKSVGLAAIAGLGGFSVFLHYLSGVTPPPAPTEVHHPEPSKLSLEQIPSFNSLSKGLKQLLPEATSEAASITSEETLSQAQQAQALAKLQALIQTLEAEAEAIRQSARAPQNSRITPIAHPERTSPQKSSQQSSQQYALQTDAFREKEDAERRRQELAGLGLGTQVQTADLEDNNTWHRVLVGPFDYPEHAKDVQNLLNQHQIQAQLKSIKPGEMAQAADTKVDCLNPGIQ